MGGQAPERLFRDDGGAALERVAQLEDENRHLRARLAQLERTRGQADTVRVRAPAGTPKFFFAGFILMTGVTGILTMLFGVARPPSPRRAPAVFVVPAETAPMTFRAVPAIPVQAAAKNGDPASMRLPRAGTLVGPPATVDDECDVPNERDLRGVKHYEKHGLAR